MIIIILLVVKGFEVYYPELHHHSNLFWFLHVPCLALFTLTFIAIKFFRITGLWENKKPHRWLGYVCGFSGYATAMVGSWLAHVR